MKLDETIKHYEEAAEKQENNAKTYPKPLKNVRGSGKKYNARIRCAKEYRQLAEWLRELKESRMVLNILGQFLVDLDIDVCCEDLTMIDDYCAEYCDNQKPLCWYRWAKAKASEVNADGSSN